MSRLVTVLGPAYLDRVLRVDRPLADPPLDQSVDGRWEFGPGLTLVDPAGAALAVELPADWPGPTGRVLLSRPILGGEGRPRSVVGLAWHDDLGGMGAGYAAAFRGTLASALGPEDDPASRSIAALLAAVGVEHRPIRVLGHPADWTLLVTSAGHGDKLPIGFRGCHAAVADLPAEAVGPCDLRVVAALPNPLAERALRAPGAAVRFFAPAMRNVLDTQNPLARFADAIDILACNRGEWTNLVDRDAVADRVAVIALTDGPAGSVVRFRTPGGEPTEVRVPAFPRAHPPRDTNRAGETYASTLVTALLDRGWRGGPASPESVAAAAERASAAAALVLDRADFGFPAPSEVDRALRAGRVD